MSPSSCVCMGGQPGRSIFAIKLQSPTLRWRPVYVFSLESVIGIIQETTLLIAKSLFFIFPQLPVNFSSLFFSFYIVIFLGWNRYWNVGYFIYIIQFCCLFSLILSSLLYPQLFPTTITELLFFNKIQTCYHSRFSALDGLFFLTWVLTSSTSS